MKLRCSSVCLAAWIFGVAVLPVHANTVWTEDFSDVSDWSVIFDPGSGSSLTSDGNLGLFHVPSAGSEAAFGPIPGTAPFVSLTAGTAANITMSLTTDSLTGSTSYDIRLDEFDAGMNYVSTVFGVLSQGTFTGTTNISLGTFSFSGSTAFVLPKVSVFTGLGDQTVRIDEISFSVIPEPSTLALALFGVALAGLIWKRK